MILKFEAQVLFAIHLRKAAFDQTPKYKKDEIVSCKEAVYTFTQHTVYLEHSLKLLFYLTKEGIEKQFLQNVFKVQRKVIWNEIAIVF